MKFIKNIGRGLSQVASVGRKALNVVGDITGRLDKQSGGLLKEAVRAVPMGQQALDVYQQSKKGVKNVQKVADVLEGRKSVSRGLRELGEDYGSQNLKDLSIGAGAVEKLSKKDYKGSLMDMKKPLMKNVKLGMI